MNIKINLQKRYHPIVFSLLMVLVASMYFILGSNRYSLANSGPYGGAIECESPEYACWGYNVPIKKIRCDEVYEREIEVCPPDNGRCDCPSDDPLTAGNESDCCCTITEYSCQFCSEGKIFPYPERPEGGHGDADKCPTDTHLGQSDGTGLTEDFSAIVYDYDQGTTLNVKPIIFGDYEPPPTPTATPPYGPTETPTPELDPSLSPTGYATSTPTLTPTPVGPTPSGGWPTHTPTPVPPTSTPTNTPTPLPTVPADPKAPCGWPVMDISSRRISGICGLSGDQPDDASQQGSWLHEWNGSRYEAIDVGTGHLPQYPPVFSTMDGYMYRCVGSTSTNLDVSYGVYTIVTQSQNDFSGYSTLFAHLAPRGGDVSPLSSDTDYYDPNNCENPGNVCLSGDCLVAEGPVNRGDYVGEADSTGPVSGPHLHYEVWYGSKFQRLCPANFMDLSAQACGGDEPNDAAETANVKDGPVFAILKYVRNLVRHIDPFINTSTSLVVRYD